MTTTLGRTTVLWPPSTKNAYMTQARQDDGEAAGLLLQPKREYVQIDTEAFIAMMNNLELCGWTYAGYIMLMLLVDVTALMRLDAHIAPITHIAVTLVISLLAIVSISISRVLSIRANHEQKKMLRHLIDAHNERAVKGPRL